MADYDYIRDPAWIYRKSFAIVEEEAKLDRFSAGERAVLTRLIHSCGMIDVVDEFACSANAVEIGGEALRKGCGIFCDVEMVKAGIIRRLLPADNTLFCYLNDDRTGELATEISNTRTAAGVELWDDRLDGGIAVIGNAPTALFRLLERIEEGGPRPALIIGIPVGFVGAVESKQALAENSSHLEYITVHGRRGGSAMASAALNAVAQKSGR